MLTTPRDSLDLRWLRRLEWEGPQWTVSLNPQTMYLIVSWNFVTSV